MKFQRLLQNTLQEWLSKREIKVVYGPRQVGKTTLIRDLLATYEPTDIITLSGDLISDREQFDFTHGQSVEKFIGKAKVLFIDEAQRFTNIWINLKIVYDRQLTIQIIVTWSSSLDIATTIHEPLTGRMVAWNLYPISVGELLLTYHQSEIYRMLPRLLVYGGYPDILLADDATIQLKLQYLTSNYLYKDVIEYAEIRKSDMIVKLLKLLAFQVWSEVSYHELGQQLWLNMGTVQKYIDLLEKSYIIHRLGSWSRNLRNEIKKWVKIYFWDLGVRNCLINDYRPFEMRQDAGGLRENFIINEYIKSYAYAWKQANFYFWRTHTQQEIDLLIESQGSLQPIEIKLSTPKKEILPSSFAWWYAHQELHVVTPQTFLAYLK